MKKIVKIILPLILGVFLLNIFPTQALEEKLLIKNFQNSNNNITGAISPEGEVVIVKILKNESGIRVYGRTPTHLPLTWPNPEEREIENGGRWLDDRLIYNDRVKKSKHTKIRDLKITVDPDPDSYLRADGHRTFFITWITEYYDKNDKFITERFHFYEYDDEYLASISPTRYYEREKKADGNDDDYVNHYPNFRVKKRKDLSYEINYNYLHYINFIFQDKNNIYVGNYNSQDAWDDGYEITEANKLSGAYKDVFSGHLFVKSKKNNFILYNVNTGIGIKEDYRKTYRLGKIKGKYLNGTYFSGKYYLLFKEEDDIKLLTLSSLNKKKYKSNSQTVFSDILGKLKAEITYNDYGDGQIIIAVKERGKDKQDLHLALKKSDGWVTNKNIFSRQKDVSFPVIRTHDNGSLSLLWKNNEQLFISGYNAGDTSWSTPRDLNSEYEEYTWQEPYSSPVIYSSENQASTLEWFQSNNGQLSLRRWNLAKNISTASEVLMPEEYQELVLHTATDDKNLIFLRQENTVHVIVATEDELFK